MKYLSVILGALLLLTSCSREVSVSHEIETLPGDTSDYVWREIIDIEAYESDLHKMIASDEKIWSDRLRELNSSTNSDTPSVKAQIRARITEMSEENSRMREDWDKLTAEVESDDRLVVVLEQDSEPQVFIFYYAIIRDGVVVAKTRPSKGRSQIK